MKYERIIAPTVTEIFESRMQAAILSGELKIGEKIPTERELGEKLGISRSSVHLGIKNLERSGFLEIQPRQGVYVANWPENGGLETLTALLRSNVLKLDAGDIESLVKIREMLEADAIRVLAAGHCQENIDALRALAAGIRAGADPQSGLSSTELAEYAFKYTHYICFHAGNMFSSLIFNSFKSFVLSLWAEWIRQVGPEAAAAYLDAATDCIAAGDGDGAVRIIYEYNLDFLARVRETRAPSR